MEPFKLTLPDGELLAGIRKVPQPSTILRYRPLIVGLHRSTYDSRYFDPDVNHTAAIPSGAFGVPFASIDRPYYGNTSSSLPILKDSSFPQETGSWLHRYTLLMLWSEIGRPDNCNCIMLLCHSIGSMGDIITAVMHVQDE